MRTTEWVLLDTETSGLSQPIYCVEVAAQRMKGISPDGPPFRALLNHNVNIESQAEALHGYSRRFLRSNGRNPVDAHRELNSYTGRRPIVSYNLSFDWARVLEPESRRLAIEPAYAPGYCALTLARRCIHETSSHKLDVLRRHFFPSIGVASHHALDDVEATRKLMLEVIWPRLERAGIASFAAVAEFSRKTPVRKCLDRIQNSISAPPVPEVSTVLDAESELVGTIEGMLADNQIVDAEVWALKHWLETHSEHQSEIARRARAMINEAFADGALSSWELDDIKVQLGRLTAYQPQSLLARHSAPCVESESEVSAGEKKRRVSLTKRQRGEECGIELLELLGRITADGRLSDAEVEEVTNWLLKNQSGELPAIGYLLDVVNDILSDGKVSDSERLDLFLGLEKVLPITERRTAKEARDQADSAAERESAATIKRAEREHGAAGELLPSTRSASWRTDPSTDAQRTFIRSMGGSARAGLTKGEASDLIETLLGNKPISSRQQMVMRFWARERRSGEGPREISEWMDQFYQEDRDRNLAWQLFKNECEDDGLQGDPDRVPLGVGPEYLARIKAGADAAVPRFRPRSELNHKVDRVPPLLQKKHSVKSKVIVGVIAAFAIFLVFVFLRRHARDPETAPTSFESGHDELPAVKKKSSPRSLPATRAPSPAYDHDVKQRYVISGLFGGARPRISIEGKLFQVGDVVDVSRGIVVQTINVDARTVTFVDRSGETFSQSLK